MIDPQRAGMPHVGGDEIAETGARGREERLGIRRREVPVLAGRRERIRRGADGHAARDRRRIGPHFGAVRRGADREIAQESRASARSRARGGRRHRIGGPRAIAGKGRSGPGAHGGARSRQCRAHRARATRAATRARARADAPRRSPRTARTAAAARRRPRRSDRIRPSAGRRPGVAGSARSMACSTRLLQLPDGRCNRRCRCAESAAMRRPCRASSARASSDAASSGTRSTSM